MSYGHKTYRDFWTFVYRIARTERRHLKKYEGLNVLYLVKYILKTVSHSINKSALDLEGSLRVIEAAIDACEPGMKPPTLSELRRFELQNNTSYLDLIESDEIPFELPNFDFLVNKEIA